MSWFRKETFLPPGIPLPGSFDEGWGLDVHSSFHKGGWHRTIVGERVYRFKYRGHKSSGRWLARACFEFLKSLETPWEVDIIIVIPPSRPKRRLSPAEFVAKKLAVALKTPFLFRTLYKTRPTRYIKEAISYQKHAIINHSMAIRHPENLSGKRIFLLDDLFKTGTTCNEAVRVLREAQAAWIGFLAWTVAKSDTL